MYSGRLLNAMDEDGFVSLLQNIFTTINNNNNNNNP